MKRFKPFTPPYNKKTIWADYRYNKMKELAEINGKQISLKEKYGRMDWNILDWCSDILLETMLDYENMSEDHCMYCNSNSKQYRTHEDSWLIHLCLPCLIWDKITIMLERIINWRTRLNDKWWPKTDTTATT